MSVFTEPGILNGVAVVNLFSDAPSSVEAVKEMNRTARELGVRRSGEYQPIAIRRDGRNLFTSIAYKTDYIAELGRSIYEKDVKPTLTSTDIGKLVAIDVESKDFTIDTDELTAIDRLRRKHPTAIPFLLRHGYRAVDSIGGGVIREPQI